MIHKIFSIFDVKAEAYLLPFTLPTIGLAVRGFTEAANNPDHDFCKYPADYTLFEVGTFDDAKCKIETHSSLIPHGSALEFQKPEAGGFEAHK